MKIKQILFKLSDQIRQISAAFDGGFGWCFFFDEKAGFLKLQCSKLIISNLRSSNTELVASLNLEMRGGEQLR